MGGVNNIFQKDIALYNINEMDVNISPTAMRPGTTGGDYLFGRHGQPNINLKSPINTCHQQHADKKGAGGF